MTSKLKKSLLVLFPVIAQRLIVTPAALCQETGLAPATVNRCLVVFQEIGILHEVTGKQRGRVYKSIWLDAVPDLA